MFVVGMIVAAGMGALTPWMMRELKTHGKVAFLTVNPKTNGINVEWKTPGSEVTTTANGESATIMQDARFLHQYQGRRAYLVNSATGSPLRVQPDTGSFQGLSGVSIYRQHRDNRIKAIQASGGHDLEQLMKYAILGVVVVGVLVLIAIGMVAKGFL